MAKRTIQTFKIDVEALRAEFTKRNLSLAQVSVEMGHCDTYINVKFNNKCMHENDAKMLELLYHIPKSAYEISDEPEEFMEDTPEPMKFDYEELYRTIYSAVFAAVKEAFK